MTKKTTPFFVLLHGWTTSLDRWQPFVEMFAGHDLRYVQLHMPGLTAPTDKAWTVPKYAEWLQGELEQIRKKHPHEEIVLIGHSFGGKISAYTLAYHPELADSLILIDSSGIRSQKVAAILKRTVVPILSKLFGIFRFVPGLQTVVHKLIGEHDYLDASSIQKKILQNVVSFDIYTELTLLKTPTLLIWGRDDQVTPLEIGQILHELILHSRLVVIDGARHAPFQTHTQRVFDEIQTFLQGET